MPDEGEENRHRPITAIITDRHAEPTHYLICPVCGGRVGFNLAELQARGGGSVYCAGRYAGPSGLLQGTEGGNDPHNHWHPSNALVGAGEIHEFVWGSGGG